MLNDRLSKGSRANVVAAVLLLASILTKATAETRFVEVARQSGIDFANVSGTPEKKYIIETQAAGVTAWDYDLDGDPDLYFTIGSHLKGKGAPTNALFRNDGGQFANATTGSGAGLQGWSMGATPADYDLDGDDDLYVTRWGRNALLRNEGGGRFTEVAALAKVDDNHWLGLDLHGPLGNPHRIGAYILVRAGGREQHRQVFSGDGFMGQNDPRLFIGLGTARLVDHLEVRWPSGQVQHYQNLTADRFYLIHYQDGLTVRGGRERMGSE